MSGFWGISWFIWGGLALIPAVIFWFVAPQAAAGLSEWQRFILRYGHTVVWVLLAISFLLRGAGIGLANVFSAAGGFMYGLFLVVMFMNR